jgi:hypothetical protein
MQLLVATRYTPYDVRGLYIMLQPLDYLIFNYILFEVNGSIWQALKPMSGIKFGYKCSVLLTLLVYLRFMALGLRPQTPADAPPLAGSM